MTQSNEAPLVEVQNLTYTHWNQTEPTLHDVSLQIRRGTLNVLVGPGGSGKSTLCDVFNGVIPHLHGGKMEGEVWVDGVNTLEAKVKDLAPKVGRVFQDPEIMFATLYVDDEIAFGPENLRFEVETIRATVEELLTTTDLAAHRHNLVWNLSGGQVQKLGLATALATHPQMIVLDEPTANLDPAATRSVHELVLSLRDEGMTTLLVTRELDEFLAEADQLMVLDEGRMLAAAPPQDVLREHGKYMVDTLGVWLPETSEIGIALHSAGLLGDRPVPITIEETLNALLQANLLSGRLAGEKVAQHVVPKGDVLISAQDLRFTYPGGIEALKGVSLDIRAGEWLAIVGRNGAGKSTLARLMVGLLKPQDGELTLFDKPAKRWKVQQLANNIALVFQNPEHQFLTDTVADEIGYSLTAQGIVEPAERERHIRETLDRLGLADAAETHPFALSAGLKRRLGVATMLVGEPQILLVDEPTYGQDKEMTHTLMALLKDIRSKGITIVMITHDMRLVQEYAERVLVMSDGRVLYDDTASALFERNDILEQANLRRTILHELLESIKQQGVEVPGVVRRAADLVDLLPVEKASG